MLRWFRRQSLTRRLAQPATVLTVVLFAAPAAAQNPDLTATFEGSSPKASFSFKWKEKGNFTRNVGLLSWDVPLTEISTAGFDRNFRTFCAEALVGVVAGRTYLFQLQAPEVPVAYDLPDTKEGQEEATRRARYVRELFGRFYPQALKEDDPDAAFAFQVALWEVTHESQIPDNPVAPFSLFTGNFQADYPNLAQSPLFVQRAETYLQALTGDDNVFSQNPALAGLQLVRMTGLPGYAGAAAAQSQFALRSVLGGAGGAGAAGAGGPGGVGPLAGGFFPGGLGGGTGFPGRGFGGFPFLPVGLGSGSPSSVVPSVPVGSTSSGGSPPSSVNTPPSIVPPVNQPTSSSGTSSGGTTSSTSSGGGSTSTSSGGQTSTSGTSSGHVTSTSSSGGAVPAPPGVLLGVLLLGALAGRRVLGQLRQPKDPDHG